MTRFARAKGSKASNERKEEEPTPWHLMRQQLADQLCSNKPQSNEQISQNLKSLLNNKPKQEEVWSEFGELNSINNDRVSNKLKQKNQGNGKILKKGKLQKEKIQGLEGATINELNSVITEKQPVHLKKNKHPEKVLNHFKECESVTVNSEKVHVIKKKAKSLNTCGSSESKKSKKTNDTKLEQHNNIRDPKESFPEVNSEKIHVIKRKVKSLNTCDSSQSKKSKKTNDTKLEQHNIRDPKESFPPNSDQSTTYQSKSVNKTATTNDQVLNTESNGVNNYGDFRNKHYTFSNSKTNRNFQTIIANGRNIKVVTYEGFLVKKSDATNLKKLRKKLREQNIDKEQIKAVMKLERRKAEKALSREKNYVCFHCRKFGHNFADCPDIKDSDMSKSGMCFKCGSLEHSHFECKVLQNQDFRYAVCFVCKEQGHIARQCSLNPQGQYPKGGSCHLCGEVTHLRKDCPKAANEKPSSSITAETLKSDQLEDISEGTSHKKKLDTRKNKVVIF